MVPSINRINKDIRRMFLRQMPLFLAYSIIVSDITKLRG